MTSKRGDFIRNPGAGGIFDKMLFKSLNQGNFNQLEFSIKNNFALYFTPAVTLNAITIIPDYQNRILSIDISYYDEQNRTSDTVSIYTNIDYATKKYDYENITFTEENLRNFCLIKKSSIPNERLVFNTYASTDNDETVESDVWTWGQFKFINLTVNDSFFADILQICNGS